MVFSKCMMTTCGVAGRWSRHRVRPWRWGAWAVAASTDILPSTLHTTAATLAPHRQPHSDLHLISTLQQGYIPWPGLCCATCIIISTHTFVPGIQLWSRWDSCNTSCCCCIAQYESKPVNDCYIFRRTPWVIYTVSCCRASDHVSFWRESIRGEYRD